MIGSYICGVAHDEGARGRPAGKFIVSPPINEPRLHLNSPITPFI